MAPTSRPSSLVKSLARKRGKKPRILALRQPLFRWIWVIVVFLHALNITYLGLAGRVYLYLVDDAPIITDTIELYNVAVSRKYYHAIAAGYLVIAVYHGYLLLNILWVSVRSRQLRFDLSEKATNDSCMALFKVTESHADVVAPSDPAMVSVLPPKEQTSTKRANWQTVIGSVTAVTKSFDPLDPNYDKMHTVRELVENALQTYQAYRSSCLVPRVLMNSCFVGLLVVNCWSTEVIHKVLGSRVAEIRVVGLAFNMLLDTVAYMVFPTMLFIPYFTEYLPQRGDLPLRYWYTDSWLSHMYQEWQMLFVRSALDGVFKFVIAFNVASTLNAVACMIEPEDASVYRETTTPPKDVVGQIASHTTPIAERKSASTLVSTVEPSSFAHRLETYSRRFLVTWGFFVLITHVVASTRGGDDQCVVQIRPWFSWRAACSLVVVKCNGDALATTGVDGGHKSFDDAISHVDEKWISILVIRHCPVIDLTPKLKELTNLVGFKIHNSTIRRWDEDAAFTATEHPMLMFVFLADVNMTDIPRGLRDPNFPPKLGDIEISKSNLTALPENLHEIWPPWLFLVMEGCQFREFPMVLIHLRPWILSITTNNFTEIPVELWEATNLVLLEVSGNPITSIPDHLASIPTFQVVHLVSTEISALPSWMDEAYLSTVFPMAAGGTPLCALLADDAKVAANTTLQLWRKNVICRAPTSHDDLTHYPLEHELIYNPE